MIDVHTDPGNEIDHVDEDSTLASDIDAEAACVVAIRLQALSIERRLGFLVLMTPGVITARPRLAILLVEFPNQPRSAVGLV